MAYWVFPIMVTRFTIRNDLVDMAKAVDEDGESDVAGVASDSI